MPRLTLILAAFLFSSVLAQGDLVLTQSLETSDATNPILFRVHGGQLRMDQPKDRFAVIIDLKTRDSITLFTNIKKYLKRSGAEIQQQMEADKKSGGATNDLFLPAAQPVPTGRFKNVDGYGTEIFLWSGAKGVSQTLWVATNYPGFDSLKPELAKLDQFNAGGPHPNAQPPLSSLPGMVVKSEALSNGRETITILKSARLQSLDPSFFELPSDYTLWHPEPIKIQPHP
jgi:hypothetical protein